MFSKPALRPLTAWMKRYSHCYIAHAIYADNVATVLHAGKLQSAEETLRTKLSVSYEEGTYDERGVASIAHAIEKLKTTPIDFPSLVNIHNVFPLDVALKFDFITKETFATFKQQQHAPATVRLKDGKDYPVIYLAADAPYIEGIPYPFQSMLCFKAKDGEVIHDKLKKLMYHFFLPEAMMQIVLDKFSANPIDKRLAPLYTLYQSLSLSGDYSECWLYLRGCRWNEIFLSKINPVIHARYCAVDWGYGDVAVLIGNPAGILGYGTHVKTLIDKITCPKFTLRPGQEVCTAQPFENNGEFFSHSLNQTNTLLIGPRALLIPYKSKGYATAYIEEMNEEELNHFRVPNRLRSYTGNIKVFSLI